MNTPTVSRAETRSQTTRLISPLQADEKVILMECEATINEGLADFIRVGTALMTIAKRKLYRESYRTFETYCKERWHLTRRMAYQKIEAAQAYENVRDCAQIAPANEFQARQLATLATPAMQQKAWEQTVASHNSSGVALTASLVREQVKMVQLTQGTAPLAACLLTDHTFPGIPLRWDMGTISIIHKTGEQRISTPNPLPKLMPSSEINHPGETPRLVMVSPDADLFASALPEAFMREFVEVLTRSPQYRFLLWTSHPEGVPSLPWPPNVEFGVRVSTQANLQRLQTLVAGTLPYRMLWLVPKEPLILPSPLLVRRVIFGEAFWPNERTGVDPATIRQLLARVVAESPALHIAATVLKVICACP
jgi:hypothetical protein